MSKAITISGSIYTVTGTVVDSTTGEGIIDLHVIAYDKDVLKDDFLGIGVTDANGAFSIEFNASKFKSLLDRKPDLYFEVKDAGLELLNTKKDHIQNADESCPPINLSVSIVNDKLRKLINKEPVPGWKGGFATSNKAFAYPDPDFSSLPLHPHPEGEKFHPDLTSLELKDNLENIHKLQRQQKVVWPEFSWLSREGDEKSRCYQMFAPDISRLGYTDTGEVFAIICPQQGTCSPHLGCMNVEVTVTGNRGWADETNRELAADMTVLGKIWFSPSSHDHPLLKRIWNHFNKEGLPFPHNKANAIVIQTYNPSDSSDPIFPLTKGLSDQPKIRKKYDYFNFDIPKFARHDGIAWTNGHLGVRIGKVLPKTDKKFTEKQLAKVNNFNQLVVDIFNTGAGNMLKEGGVLTWNVWFTAPEEVDNQEWEDHATVWRDSIDADHGSPEGPGTIARHLDGSPFKPLKELLAYDLTKVLTYLKDHLID